jgi:hypothetical protein
MPLSYEQVTEAAMQLSQEERLILADLLWISVDKPEDVTQSWLEEAERRGEAFERGEMGAVDFDESIASLRAKLAARRKAHEEMPPS